VILHSYSSQSSYQMHICNQAAVELQPTKCTAAPNHMSNCMKKRAHYFAAGMIQTSDCTTLQQNN
jgi:hypothetical protein